MTKAKKDIFLWQYYVFLGYFPLDLFGYPWDMEAQNEPVAQLVEHLTFNQVAEGSSPSWLTENVSPSSSLA